MPTVRVPDAEVEPARRSNIPRGEDAHAREVARRLRPTGEQIGLRIAEARDPVRAAQPCEVRVAIDETGDDGRSGRVDDLGAARIGRAVVGTDVLDAAVAHENGDPAPQRR